MLWAMADLANVFSWSRSRAGMFEDCRRRYYYHYYGAWGGWDSSAPPDVRRLYVLKQLTGRQGWAGRTVHSAVELVLRALHAGRGAVRGAPDRGHRGAHARGVAVLPPRGISRAAEGGRRPLRARVRRRGEGPGLAGPPGPRLPVSPELLPAAAPRRHPAHAAGALDPDRGHSRVRVRGHARSTRRPTSGTGRGRTGSRWSTGRPGAPIRTRPRSSWAATRSMPGTSWTCRRSAWISSR